MSVNNWQTYFCVFGDEAQWNELKSACPSHAVIDVIGENKKPGTCAEDGSVVTPVIQADGWLVNISSTEPLAACLEACVVQPEYPKRLFLKEGRLKG